MVLSAVSGNGVSIPATGPSQIDSSVVRQIEQRKSAQEIGSTIATEEYVRKYFSDIPIMVEIARCESHFKQFDPDGTIHRGVVNPADVGVMQINESYHLDRAKQNNYNIYSIEGNVSYARELYEDRGTKPWNSSKPCWGKYVGKTISNELAVK